MVIGDKLVYNTNIFYELFRSYRSTDFISAFRGKS